MSEGRGLSKINCPHIKIPRLVRLARTTTRVWRSCYAAFTLPDFPRNWFPNTWTAPHRFSAFCFSTNGTSQTERGRERVCGYKVLNVPEGWNFISKTFPGKFCPGKEVGNGKLL